MTQPIKTALHYLGYPEPMRLLERGALIPISMLCGNLAAKIFVPNLSLKSHFAFGQISATTFYLLLNNRRIHQWIDGETNVLKKDLFRIVPYFLAVVTIPVVFGKIVVSRWIEPLTLTQSFKRGVYYGGFGIITLSGYALYQLDKKR